MSGSEAMPPARRAIATLSIALSLIAVSSATGADADLGGVWRTGAAGGLVAFKACGSALCGYLVESAAPEALVQTLLIDRLTRAGAGWSGGRIRDPRNGMRYEGEVRLLGDDRLKVTGCLVHPFCRSQVWDRVR